MEPTWSLAHLLNSAHGREYEREAWTDDAATTEVAARRATNAACEYQPTRFHYETNPTVSSAASVSDDPYPYYTSATRRPQPQSLPRSSSQLHQFPYELFAPQSPEAPVRDSWSDTGSGGRPGAQPVARGGKRTTEERREARQCSVDGCRSYTIDRGRCFRHGGGKHCSREGCARSAKARGLCWRHGGSVGCSVAGCDRGAKSRGLCSAHGGGTQCSIVDCEKTIISKGVCWTHGGGKRCTFDGCKRPASASKYDFCNHHYAELHDGNVVYEV